MALTDMDTPVVYNAGRNVTSLSGEAGAAGTGFLQAVSNAESTVVHQTVAGALGKYYETWSQPANRMKVDVESLGGRTPGSASTIGAGDADGGTVTSVPAVDSQDMAARIGASPIEAV
jgi:hypothetical protein